MIRALLAASLFLAQPAFARPPPPGSPDALIMQDFAEWIMTQHQNSGGICCSLSDGRPLDGDEIRMNGDHMEILYAKRHWDQGTDEWLPVPPETVLHVTNPTGYVIAWVTRGHIYCLSLTGAV